MHPDPRCVVVPWSHSVPSTQIAGRACDPYVASLLAKVILRTNGTGHLIRARRLEEVPSGSLHPDSHRQSYLLLTPGPVSDGDFRVDTVAGRLTGSRTCALCVPPDIRAPPLLSQLLLIDSKAKTFVTREPALLSSSRAIGELQCQPYNVSPGQIVCLPASPAKTGNGCLRAASPWIWSLAIFSLELASASSKFTSLPRAVSRWSHPWTVMPLSK